jgi:hypothetical protein
VKRAYDSYGSRGQRAPSPGTDLIEQELTAYRRWQEAFLRGDEERPSLPASEPGARLPIAVAVSGLRALLMLVARLSAGSGASSLRVWAAQKIVELDRFALEPASCGLNRAYTRLGLAKLAAGDELGAIHCLRNSWRVHPCPHNTAFGLSPALWRAIAAVPGASAARDEYEGMARRFRGHFGDREWPLRRTSWRDLARSLTARWS